MELEINKKYQTFSSELYKLLSKKYNVQEKNFSPSALESLAFLIGNIQKKISFDETNKILNISRALKEVSRGYLISQKELDELQELYSYFNHINKNKHNELSELEKNFRKLSMQSKDAIVNENEFDEFKEYMHIKRPIETEFENALENHLVPNPKSVLFIVGNVGDGKSHILSYTMKKHPDTFREYQIKIHNDATETDSPKSTALETMKRVLQPFSEDNINDGKESRLIVAINLGVLTNLIEELHSDGKFSSIVSFLQESHVLSSRRIVEKNNSKFKIISFTEKMNFQLIDGKIKSRFYEEALRKIYSISPDNPFYQAYENDIKNGMNKLLHSNYEFMLREDFQKSIVYLLTRAEIEYKIIISARMLFNFFFDISMPRDANSAYNSYLPYLLFENNKRSDLLTLISTLDPIKKQTRKIDEASIELYHAPDVLTKVNKLLGNESESFYRIFQSFKGQQEKFDNFINTYLRLRFLMNYEDELFDNAMFEQYLQQYSIVQAGGQVVDVFKLVNRSFSKWNGDSGLDGYIVKNPGKGRVKVLVEIDLMPIDNFISGTSIGLTFNANNEDHEIIIDYRTYEILSKLNMGYFLKEEDRQVAIKFDLFVNKLVNSVKSVNKNMLLDLITKERYELKRFLNNITLTKGSV